MHSLYLLALFPLTALASVGGHCSGTATGDWKTDGICEYTSTCSSYGGKPTPGGCPDDPDDVECCLIGLDTSAATNPCGDYSFCAWTTNSVCADDDGSFHAGYCPGPSTYECCKF